MNEELVIKQIERCENRLNNHADRIDKLEQYQAEARVEIRNLCEQIKSLVSIIKWFLGILISSSIGFIFWYIQK